MKTTWTVTCNGDPWKVSDNYSECLRFIDIQKRKLKGAGLADRPVTDVNFRSRAASCAWAIRKELPGDRAALVPKK